MLHHQSAAVHELRLRQKPVIERQGARRILVTLHRVQDLQRLAGCLAKPAASTLTQGRSSLCRDRRKRSPWRAPAGVCDCSIPSEINRRPAIIEDRVIVSDDNIRSRAGSGRRAYWRTASYIFVWTGTGHRTFFGQWTEENVGQMIAIIVDEQVISAPYVREPILGGSGPDFAAISRCKAPRILPHFCVAGSDFRKAQRNRDRPRTRLHPSACLRSRMGRVANP